MKHALMALAVLFLLAAPARAETAAEGNTALPTKENLLAAWEESLSADPHTVHFEKTGEDGVYLYETTLFPYKGRLKINNVLVAPREPYDYYDDTPADSVGTIEAGLEGLSREQQETIPWSIAQWENGNRFYFADGAWITKDEWYARKRAARSSPAPSCAPAEKAGRWHALLLKSWDVFRNTVIALAAMLVVLLPIFFLQRGRVRKYNAMNEGIVERQKRAVALAEENAALLREQVALLKQLAGKS